MKSSTRGDFQMWGAKAWTEVVDQARLDSIGERKPGLMNSTDKPTQTWSPKACADKLGQKPSDQEVASEGLGS